jgi:hypothetical protein
MQRMIVSLTTTPVRIGAIRDMLLALARQDGEFSEVLLNIPHRLSRTGELYEIPDWLGAIPKVRINRCRDYGPATKLLGALECESDPDTLIVTVDDDVLYPPGIIAAYRQYAADDGACAYCAIGFDIPDPFAAAKALVRGALRIVDGHLADVQVAAAYGSCLYRRAFFDDGIFDVAQLPGFLFYSDDIYIANHLARKDIAVKTVHFGGLGGAAFWESRLLPHGLHGDALHRNAQVGTNRERYAMAIDYLIRNDIYFLDRRRRGSRPATAIADVPAPNHPVGA